METQFSESDMPETREIQGSSSLMADSNCSYSSLESLNCVSVPSFNEAQASSPVRRICESIHSQVKSSHFSDRVQRHTSPPRLSDSFSSMPPLITVPIFHVVRSPSPSSVRFHEWEPPTRKKSNGNSKGKEQPCIQMAIRPASPNLRLTEEQGKFIQSELVQALDKTPPKSPQPNFVKSFFDQGMFWMACENERSRDWLIKNVRILNDKYEDLNLIVQGVKFPKRPIVYLDLPEVSSTVEIIDRLGKQNGNLRTEFWFILRRHLYKSWQRITFSIDIDSFQFLESVNFTVNWKLRTIIFRVPAKVYKSRTEQERRQQEGRQQEGRQQGGRGRGRFRMGPTATF